MFDFNRFQNDCGTFSNQSDFSKYLESSFEELESYFAALEINQLNDMKFVIEDFLYDLMDDELIVDDNPPRINAFLLLLSEQFERANLIGAITIIRDYLPESAIKNRLAASILYLKVNDISKDYHERFPTILELITKSDDEYEHKVVNSVLNYFLKAMEHFSRLQNSDLSNSFKKLFLEEQTTYRILKNELIKSVIEKVTTDNYTQVIKDVQQQLSHNTISDYDKLCKLDKNIAVEKSDYSKKVYALNDPDFNKIKQISVDYINSIGSTFELYARLNRGIKIIDEESLLYQYIFSFSNMHKAKLYDAFETILPKLNHTTINIIDWGCGQALAAILLLEYIKENKLKIDIRNVTLIEPSKLALSRGLLHVDVLKQKKYNVKAINKDLDCLEPSDIRFNDDNVVLHLFSNILDVESFNLDKTFLQKISNNIQTKNYFTCVSPNINDKRNGRLDLFYKYFDENFDTNIISSRDMDIGSYRRYEKVFEVNYTREEEVEKVRDEIQDYHVDIYTKLDYYKSIVSPIIKPSKLKENIENDPDYVIFKIRKVTEIITSKIYSQYENDESRVSQNDKINYLQHNKKVLSRKAVSHLHTIRTIGNISVHEHIENPSEILKEDAYFLIAALVLLIEELIKKNILSVK